VQGIGTNIALRTYREFERSNVTTPENILNTGWDGLVKILDDGGYARYDFSTATRLLLIMEDLENRYDGDFNRLYEAAVNEKELEHLLKGLGKGIGDVTVNIFLRELRTVWHKAQPKISPMAIIAAKNLDIIKREDEVLKTLEDFWLKNSILGYDFYDFEAALLRLGKDYCKKSKCDICPLKSACVSKKI